MTNNPDINQSKIVYFTPDALTVIHSRKSVRNFTGEGVTKDQLETILKAGMAAPTAVNMQPWTFVVVTNRSVLDKMGDILPFAKMLYKAGACIVVCGDPARAHEGKKEYAIIDCAAATENILLAAEAIGLGAVWTQAYPSEESEEMIRRTLSIPVDVIPVSVIPIGHPTGEDIPKEKYKIENVKWEKWK